MTIAVTKCIVSFVVPSPDVSICYLCVFSGVGYNHQSYLTCFIYIYILCAVLDPRIIISLFNFITVQSGKFYWFELKMYFHFYKDKYQCSLSSSLIPFKFFRHNIVWLYTVSTAIYPFSTRTIAYFLNLLKTVRSLHYWMNPYTYDHSRNSYGDHRSALGAKVRSSCVTTRPGF